MEARENWKTTIEVLREAQSAVNSDSYLYKAETGCLEGFDGFFVTCKVTWFRWFLQDTPEQKLVLGGLIGNLSHCTLNL